MVLMTLSFSTSDTPHTFSQRTSASTYVRQILSSFGEGLTKTQRMKAHKVSNISEEVLVTKPQGEGIVKKK